MQSDDKEGILISSNQYYINHSNYPINNSTIYISDPIENNSYQNHETIPYNNIADISNPSQENVMEILYKNYQNQQIYIGFGHNNIILLNPFDDTYKLNDQNIQDFINNHQNHTNFQNTQPHILNLAEKATQACFSQNNISKKSSIIIQGNSGSGKTEAVKNILNYITMKSNSELLTTNVPSIEKRIISTKIILEAFGNAKTINNPNSSRYGLNLQIHFDNQQKISSAKIITILFERARIIEQREMERNFHIFYQLYIAYQRIEDLKDFAQQNKDNFLDIANIVGEMRKLQLNSYFDILRSHKDDDSDQQIKKQDFENFKKLLLAFRDLNFSSQDILNIIQCLAGLIHLYEFNFTKAEELLKIENLETTINSYISDFNKQSKKRQKDSIINEIIMDFYNKLFSWIQNKINQNLSSGQEQNEQYTLNIFDSFGLDIIENEQGIQQNKLEQLMQNYVYEKLLSTFYNQIKNNAQKLKESENLKKELVDLQANDEVIKLFENVIFNCIKNFNQQILKEMIKQQTENVGVQNVFNAEPKKRESLTQSQRFRQQEQPIIGIKHTGDEIFYQIDEFAINNNYPVSENVQNINLLSQNPIIKSFIPQPQDEAITDKTQNAINELIDLFGTSQTYFVKCFLTNYQQVARSFDWNVIYTQLTQSGILQSALLLYQFYFISLPKSQFLEKYVNSFPMITNEENLQYYIYCCNKDKELISFGQNSILIKEHLKKQLEDLYQFHLGNIPYLEDVIQYNKQIDEVNADHEKIRQQLMTAIISIEEEYDKLKKREELLVQTNTQLQAILMSNREFAVQLMSLLKFKLEQQKNQENQGQKEEGIGQFGQIY